LLKGEGFAWIRIAFLGCPASLKSAENAPAG